jgi:hypothetical protein
MSIWNDLNRKSNYSSKFTGGFFTNSVSLAAALDSKYDRKVIWDYFVKYDGRRIKKLW